MNAQLLRERGRLVRNAPTGASPVFIKFVAESHFALRAQCGRDVRAPSKIGLRKLKVNQYPSVTRLHPVACAVIYLLAKTNPN
jgi:hypothetical protein